MNLQSVKMTKMMKTCYPHIVNTTLNMGHIKHKQRDGGAKKYLCTTTAQVTQHSGSIETYRQILLSEHVAT